MAKKTRKIDVTDTSGFGGGFADLLRAQGLAPTAPLTPEPAVAQVTPAASGAVAHTLRVDRKGRRGKTVTLVEGVADGVDLKALAKRLRKHLGCGVSVEGGALVVQGDQRERIERALS